MFKCRWDEEHELIIVYYKYSSVVLNIQHVRSPLSNNIDKLLHFLIIVHFVLKEQSVTQNTFNVFLILVRNFKEITWDSKKNYRTEMSFSRVASVCTWLQSRTNERRVTTSKRIIMRFSWIFSLLKNTYKKVINFFCTYNDKQFACVLFSAKKNLCASLQLKKCFFLHCKM